MYTLKKAKAEGTPTLKDRVMWNSDDITQAPDEQSGGKDIKTAVKNAAAKASTNGHGGH